MKSPVCLIVLLCLLSVASASRAFGPDIIHQLPPTVAEWHSLEGMEFAVAAQTRGLSWAQAHEVFTGQRLRAFMIRPNRIVVYSASERSDWIDLLEVNPTNATMQLRITHDPAHASHQSQRDIWVCIAQPSWLSMLWQQQ
jgi:hypothetical protein